MVFCFVSERKKERTNCGATNDEAETKVELLEVPPGDCKESPMIIVVTPVITNC